MTRIIIFIFSFCLSIDVLGQDQFEFANYWHSPNGDDYNSAKNSLRIQNNKIRKIIYYTVKFDNGKVLDSTFQGSSTFNVYGYCDTTEFRDKFKRKFPYENYNYHLKRDSIISAHEKKLKRRKGKKTKAEKPFSNIGYIWHDKNGNIYRFKYFSNLLHRTKYYLTYNDKNEMISCARYDGKLWVKKKSWEFFYEYDSKGNMIELYSKDGNGNKKGGQRFYYEYW